jgi:hypothetical protein
LTELTSTAGDDVDSVEAFRLTPIPSSGSERDDDEVLEQVNVEGVNVPMDDETRMAEAVRDLGESLLDFSLSYLL